MPQNFMSRESLPINRFFQEIQYELQKKVRHVGRLHQGIKAERVLKKASPLGFEVKQMNKYLDE